MKFLSILLTIMAMVVLFTICTHHRPHPYAEASLDQRQHFKRTSLPFKPRISFLVHQGAFGVASHHESGNEYHWDLDVPYGTEVIAVEAGRVIQRYEPEGEGGCAAQYADQAHNLKIEHADGTVAQYVHIDSLVDVGDAVEKGQIIARTAKNGWICRPHLHFGVYRSKDHLYYSRHRETLPLYFPEIPGGLLLENHTYQVPEASVR